MSARRQLKSGDRAHADLHVCPDCASKLVEPTDWWQLDESRWEVQLRCPECQWRGSGTHAQADLDRFDRVLDRGVESILDDLSQLARTNMEDEVDRFVAAIDSDRILPEDF